MWSYSYFALLVPVFLLTDLVRYKPMINFEGAAGNATADQPFFMASITKMFAAAVLMQLVDEGRIRLDDRVASHLPHVELTGLNVVRGTDYADQLTLRHLLHRSLPGDPQQRGNIEQRKQYKTSLRNTGMRQIQPGQRTFCNPVYKEVEIDNPRPPAIPG